MDEKKKGIRTAFVFCTPLGICKTTQLYDSLFSPIIGVETSGQGNFYNLNDALGLYTVTIMRQQRVFSSTYFI